MAQMIEPRKLFGGLGNRLFQMAYIMAQEYRGAIPDIYVQNPEYFEEVGNKVRLLFGQGMIPSNYISLHIRRGDYVGNPYYVDLSETEYYDHAIAQFPNQTFLVFCADGKDTDADDREWCQRFLDKKGIDYVMASGIDEIEDFNRMAGCKSHIGANSSFSWWASYVGGGKTIMPSVENWFSDGVDRVGCLDEWIRI